MWFKSKEKKLHRIRFTVGKEVPKGWVENPWVSVKETNMIPIVGQQVTVNKSVGAVLWVNLQYDDDLIYVGVGVDPDNPDHYLAY